MKCIICHGNNIKVKEVKEEFPQGNNVVIVSLTVPVCYTCGERYYDRRSMQFLEEITEKIKNSQINCREIGKVLVYEGSG